MFTGKEILKVLPNAECEFRDFTVSSVVTDSRKDCTGALFVALVGEIFDGHDYLEKAVSSGASALLISKAPNTLLPDELPVIQVADTLTAYQLLARNHREKMDCKVIGVTGSSGKTSTKEIIKAILVPVFGSEAVLATEGNTNNHIGVPQNLLKLTAQHRFAVIEMGTNHPGEIEVLARTALPDISVISSVGNAHIEFLGSIDGVAREKSAIFAGYPDSTGDIKVPIAVFPASGKGNAVMREEAGPEFYTFGTQDADLIYEYLGGNLHGSSFRLTSEHGSWSDSVQWSLQGEHQASNAAAAALTTSIAGVSEADIEAAFKKCTLPGMRMSITEKAGITWINDAYNANPDSVKATLDWLAEFANVSNMKIVLGDMLEIGEQADFFHLQVLEYALEKLPRASVFAVGEEMSKVLVKNPQLQTEIKSFLDSGLAAKELPSIFKPGDMIFLKASRGTKLEKILEY